MLEVTGTHSDEWEMLDIERPRGYYIGLGGIKGCQVLHPFTPQGLHLFTYGNHHLGNHLYTPSTLFERVHPLLYRKQQGWVGDRVR